MQKYTGNLSRLGTSRTNPQGTVYTLIEIGDHRLKKVFVSDALDGVLHEGLTNPEPITVWTINYFGKKIIAGVSRADGVVFRAKMTGIIPAIFVTLIGGFFLYSSGDENFGTFNLIMGSLSLLWALYFFKLNFDVLKIPANDTI